MRSDVSFSSDGTACAAWLYRPDTEGRAPLVVMAHGFSATRELRLDAYAERLAAAGLGELLFDYATSARAPASHASSGSIAKQHADYHAAIATVAVSTGSTRTRVAVFGSSFSGGHVLAVAAQDPGLAAVVSQCPYTDGLATLPRLGAVNAVKLTPAGLRDQVRAPPDARPTTFRQWGSPVRSA